MWRRRKRVKANNRIYCIAPKCKIYPVCDANLFYYGYINPEETWYVEVFVYYEVPPYRIRRISKRLDCKCDLKHYGEIAEQLAVEDLESK